MGYGAIEAACGALGGIDLVFLDSDGSSELVFEWTALEKACVPRLVLILNLSLPRHGGWIKERLLGLGYTEIWTDRAKVHDVPYTTMGYSDVRRIRSWSM